jgi:transposase
MSSRISQEYIDQVIWELAKHMSHRKVAVLLHVGRERVANVVRSYSKGGKLDHERGRPKKLGRVIMDHIVTVAITNGHLTDQMIADAIEPQFGFSVSRSSVNNARHAIGFKFPPPKKVPHLNQDQILRRQQFVLDWKYGELFRDIKQLPLVFSDESRFCFCSDNKWRWQRRGEYLLCNMSQQDKFPHFSIMVWGAIGINFKSRHFG